MLESTSLLRPFIPTIVKLKLIQSSTFIYIYIDILLNFYYDVFINLQKVFILLILPYCIDCLAPTSNLFYYLLLIKIALINFN